jgi:hypothetical protein
MRVKCSTSSSGSRPSRWRWRNASTTTTLGAADVDRYLTSTAAESILVNLSINLANLDEENVLPGVNGNCLDDIVLEDGFSLREAFTVLVPEEVEGTPEGLLLSARACLRQAAILRAFTPEYVNAEASRLEALVQTNLAAAVA